MDIGPWPWIATHALGFICLVLLMRKAAWRPILNFLDERRASIEKQFHEVEALKQEAEKTRKDYQEQMRHAQAEARELVVKARADAERLAESLRAENQAALDKSRREASAQIAQEAELARLELRRYAAELAVTVAEKFLSEGLSPEQKRQLTEKTLPEVEQAASRN
ncbi:MAG: F0F1 ATP synthase subunit B [Candidatus Omnitrophica bacterium]|nr:MAG: ATP synthase subunit b [Candidatus Hinthialibacteria bacterium OLB16]MCK6496292.1 F0F1 ATP synthase subunit B [bacterium]MCL4734426.1 F0F1 ATP synthase subunit B [Candidatus Omnitrophota bacterium]NUP93168.1 F0F1 ATP synthase subunit B [Candidatus Omnitrophota bacterium]